MPTLSRPHRDMKDKARREFEAWSSTYDRSLLNRFLFQPAHLAMMEEVARWVAEHSRPLRLLDVGCGTGTFAGLVARKTWQARLVALDYSLAMCRVTASKSRELVGTNRVSPVNADSEHLPFADGSFDLVTCANSFHHYPNQQAVVNEMRRVLAGDGRLVLVDGFRDNIVGWVAFDVIVARVEGAVHHAPWTQIHEYFMNAGFSAIRRKKVSVFLPLLMTVGEADPLSTSRTV